MSVIVPANLQMKAAFLVDASGNPVMSTSALLVDGAAVPQAGLIGAANLLYNGATFDLQRSNIEGVALASAARTAGINSADITNYNARGVVFFLNITAASGTGGLQVTLQAKDPMSGAYTQINVSPTAVVAAGLKYHVFYPGASGGNTTQTTGSVLPRIFRFTVLVGDATSYTYSLSYGLVI